jgi:tetratricopeptide (TPR) repeat protein
MSSVTPPENAGSATPEVPPITPAIRRRLQQCYDHAKKLMAQPKYDFDYANTSLTECITSDPGNLVYVEAFFENLAKKYDNNKKGAKLQLFLNRSPFKKALANKQWLEVLKTGPEILKVNPWDSATLRGMAEACEHLQLSEVELRYLKNALDGNPKDAEVNRHCARSLARMGQYDQAIACWARVSEIKRNDPEAQKMIGDLQIEKTKWKFGMLSPDDRNKRAAAGQGSAAKPASKPTDEMKVSRPSAAEASLEVDTSTPAEESPKKREIQLTPSQRLEQAIQNDPTIIENYLELATVYADEGRLADAEKTLQKGLAASGNELRVRERLEEVHVLRVKQQLAIAERRAKADATEAAKELMKQLRENLNRVELEMFGHRAQRYPAEAHWKLELGIRLKRAGNFSEAIKRLAEIGSESDLAAAATLEMGESWQHLRQYPRALQAYRQATELAEKQANADQLKLALYRGGVLGAAMGDPAGGEMLGRLVTLDSDYRDAKERLARLATAKS